MVRAKNGHIFGGNIMNKLVLMGSISLFSFTLIGCNTMNSAENSVNQTGGAVVSTGAHLVSATGHAIGSTFNTGVGYLTGKQAKPNYVVYHNGHKYRLHNGRYVLVH